MVIKTKVIMVGLKFFCKTHQVSDCGGIDYGYLSDPKDAIKMFFKGNKSKTCGTNMTAVLSGVPCLVRKLA